MNRWSKDRLTDEQLQAFARRYTAGESIATLLKEAPGYTYAGFHAGLKREGVKFRGRRGPSPKKVTLDDRRASEALSLWDEGMSYVRAAEQVGLASITLRRLLVESGHDPQKHWKGEGARNWKGGRQRTTQGYVRVMADEFTESMGDGRGQVLEHRLVMARHLGRPLEPHETVHHKNGKCDDNRIENLQLRNGKHGNGRALCCADCGSRNIVAADLD